MRVRAALLRHPAARGLVPIAAAAVGALFGFGAHVALELVADGPAALQAPLWPPSDGRLSFLLAAAGFGLLTAAEVVGLFRLEGVLRAVAGIAAGGLAGLLLYVVGYVAAAPPSGNGPFIARGYEALVSLTVVELFSVLLGAVLGFLVVRYAWRFHGILAYVALVSVVVGYFVYAFRVTLPRVPRGDLPVSLVLLVAESASLALVVVYSFYALDISSRKAWRRSPDLAPFSKYFLPRVAFHVTVFNEPADLVKETLDALGRLDYPRDRYVVMVLDDSTDEALRKDLEARCRELGHAYVHRDDRKGYKAGALNHALTLTPKDVDLIAVIDADYQVEPEYLRETVGYFVNPNLGFLQTPQDYRNMHQSFLTEQYYYADAYFYRAIMPSRNEENAIIFCGTMGLLRRGVLEDAGGWAEDHITEDSELSVRILERGYDALYVNRTYGRGLIPATYEAYKKQLHRWSFGSVRVLKSHFRRFLFSPLSLRQKFDFLIGSLHWFDGVFVVAIAATVAALAVADLSGARIVTHHQREIWLVGLVPLFLLIDGVLRIHVALRRAMNVPVAATLRVIGMWYSIKFNNMAAAVKSLVGVKMPFVRTPKSIERRPPPGEAAMRALRLTPFESASALLLAALASATAARILLDFSAGIPPPSARVLLAFWLLYYAIVFCAAPLYAYKAYVTFTPDRELFRARGARAADGGG